LLNDLQNSHWDSAFVFDEVDDVLDALELILNDALKVHLPSKQKRVKKSKQPAWINDDILVQLISVTMNLKWHVNQILRTIGQNTKERNVM
jgi:hypothetical protein